MSEKENKYKKFILPVSLSIVFLVAGFGLGVLFQKNHLKSSFSNRSGQFQMMGQNNNTRASNQAGQNGSNSAGPRNNNGGFVTGEITKIDDTSITLKTIDGSSKIILISDSTAFNKSATAAKTDLKVGSQVRVDGTTDTNTGSVTGKSIEIDPARNGQTTPAQQ